MASENLCALEIQPHGRQDDEAARLVQTHERLIRRYAARDRRDKDAAADVAQGARIRLWAWAQRHAGRPCSRSLVRRVVRCSAIAQVREQQRCMSPIDSTSLERFRVAQANLVAVEASGEDVIAKKLISAWLVRLPLRLRAVYCGLYRRELSQREVARRMRLTQPRVAQLHADLLRLARRRFGSGASA